MIFVHHHFLPQVIVELPALHVLQNQDDAVFVFEDLVDVDYVWMVEANQHFYFIFGSENVGLIEFCCEDLLVLFTDCSLYCAGGSV